MLTACGTTKTPEPQSPVQPAPVVTEVPPQPDPAPQQPETPALSPAMQALHDAVDGKDPDAIRTAAHDVIDSDTDSPDATTALCILARTELSDGHAVAAQRYAEKALERDAQNYDALMTLARSAQAQDRLDEAVKTFDRAAAAKADAAEPHAAKAAILLMFLDYERALAEAEAASQLAPDDCRVLTIHADTLYAAHRFPDAVAQYTKAEAKRCELPMPALVNLAKLYEVHIQDAAMACKTYQRLVALDPENPYYKASMDYQCAQNP